MQSAIKAHIVYIIGILFLAFTPSTA